MAGNEKGSLSNEELLAEVRRMFERQYRFMGFPGGFNPEVFARLEQIVFEPKNSEGPAMDEINAINHRLSELSKKIDESKDEIKKIDESNKGLAGQLKVDLAVSLVTHMGALNANVKGQIDTLIEGTKGYAEAASKVAINRSESAEKIAGLALSSQTAVKTLFGVITIALFAAFGGLYLHGDAKFDALNSKFDAKFADVNQRFTKIEEGLGQLLARSAPTSPPAKSK